MKPLLYTPALVATLLAAGCNKGQQTSLPATQSSGSAAPQQVQLPQQPAPPVSVSGPVPQSAQTAVPAPSPSKPSPSQPVSQQSARNDRYAEPPQAVPADLTIPAGTVFDVRLDQAIDTRSNRSGDRFDATLRDAIVVDHRAVLPRGTRFIGHVVDSRASGRLKGHAELSISLDAFEMGGHQYDIRTSHFARASNGHKKRNWWIIGGGSGVGSAIGAIAGGPAGALIGAGAGAGAGTAGAAITGKKQVRLPAETLLSFRLREPVAVAN